MKSSACITRGPTLRLIDAARGAGPASRLRVVDTMVSGTHENGSSHHQLLRAFVDDATLERMYRRLERARHRTHEFGDSILVERHADEVPGSAERPGSAESFGRAPIPPQRPRTPCRNFSRSSGGICAQRSAIRSRQCMP